MPSMQSVANLNRSKPSTLTQGTDALDKNESLNHESATRSFRRSVKPLAKNNTACLRRIGRLFTLSLSMTASKASALSALALPSQGRHLRGHNTPSLTHTPTPPPVFSANTTSDNLPSDAKQNQPFSPLPQPRRRLLTSLDIRQLRPEDAQELLSYNEPNWVNDGNNLFDYQKGINQRQINANAKLALVAQLAQNEQINALAIDEEKIACITDNQFIKVFEQNAPNQWQLSSSVDIFDAFNSVTSGEFDQIALSGDQIAISGKVSTQHVSGILALGAYRMNADKTLTEVGSPNMGNPPQPSFTDIHIVDQTVALQNQQGIKMVKFDETHLDPTPIKTFNLNRFGKVIKAFYLPDQDLALSISEGKVEAYSLEALLAAETTQPPGPTAVIELPNTSKILKAQLWDSQTLLLLQAHDQLSIVDLNKLSLVRTKNLSYQALQGFTQLAQVGTQTLALRTDENNKITLFQNHSSGNVSPQNPQNDTSALPKDTQPLNESANLTQMLLDIEAQTPNLGANGKHIASAVIPPLIIGGLQSLVKSFRGALLFLRQGTQEEKMNLIKHFLQIDQHQPIDTSTDIAKQSISPRAPALSFANDVAGTAVGSIVAGRYLVLLDAGGQLLTDTDHLIQTVSKGISALLKSQENNPLIETTIEFAQTQKHKIDQLISLAKAGATAQEIMDQTGVSQSFRVLKDQSFEWLSVSEFLVNSQLFDLAGMPKNEVGNIINNALRDMLFALNLVTGYGGRDGGSVIDEIIVSSINYAVRHVGNARAEEKFISAMIDAIEKNFIDAIESIKENPEIFEKNIALIEDQIDQTVSDLFSNIQAIQASVTKLQKKVYDLAKQVDDPILTTTLSTVGTMLGRYSADAIGPTLHGIIRPFAMSLLGQETQTEDVANAIINCAALSVSAVTGSLVGTRVNKLERTAAGMIGDIGDSVAHTKQLITDLKADLSSAANQLTQSQWSHWEGIVNHLIGHQNLVNEIDNYTRNVPKSSADTVVISPYNLGQNFGYIAGRIVDNFLADSEEIKNLSEEAIVSLKKNLQDTVSKYLSYANQLIAGSQGQTLEITKVLLDELEKQIDKITEDVDRLEDKIPNLIDVIGVSLLMAGMTLLAIDAMGIRRKLLACVQPSPQVS